MIKTEEAQRASQVRKQQANLPQEDEDHAVLSLEFFQAMHNRLKVAGLHHIIHELLQSGVHDQLTHGRQGLRGDHSEALLGALRAQHAQQELLDLVGLVTERKGGEERE